jgi:hypothetical protein
MPVRDPPSRLQIPPILPIDAMKSSDSTPRDRSLRWSEREALDLGKDLFRDHLLVFGSEIWCTPQFVEEPLRDMATNLNLLSFSY